MAYKAKFLHFKTKQSYNTERNKTVEGTDERKVFDAYISFIDEGPTICTWGKEYKCELSKEEIESLIDSKGFITVEDIPTAGTITPIIAGTAATGSSEAYAREDHVHPAQTNITGNAGTASKLQTARTISLTGDVVGSGSFNGSQDISIPTAVGDNTHHHNDSTIDSLDASKLTGTIDIERLPKGALERLVIVDNQAARYKLTSSDVQEGDTVKEEDTGLLYFVVDVSNLSNENGYKVYTAGAATSVPWSGVTGKPSFLQLGETSTTAYSGDKGKKTADIVATLPQLVMEHLTDVTATEDKLQINYLFYTKTNDGSYDGDKTDYLNIPVATGASAGIITADDKIRIDGIPSIGTAVPRNLAKEAAVGTSLKYAREDHVHAEPSKVKLAQQLWRPIQIALTGAVTGYANTDCSTDVSITTKAAEIDGSAITTGTIDYERIASREFNTQLALYAKKAGDTFTGPIILAKSNNKINLTNGGTGWAVETILTANKSNSLMTVNETTTDRKAGIYWYNHYGDNNNSDNGEIIIIPSAHTVDDSWSNQNKGFRIYNGVCKIDGKTLSTELDPDTLASAVIDAGKSYSLSTLNEQSLLLRNFSANNSTAILYSMAPYDHTFTVCSTSPVGASTPIYEQQLGKYSAESIIKYTITYHPYAKSRGAFFIEKTVLNP